jgi:acyl-CoA synthetase (AMP-forming)/AMP-acid ligase II
MPASVPHRAEALLTPWAAVLAERASQPAVLAADGSVARTFAQIEEEAQRLAGDLAELPPRAIVAVRLGNAPAWPAVFLALLRAGHLTLPLGSDSTPPPFAHALLDPALRLNALDTRDWAPPAAAVLLKLTSGTTGTPRAIWFTAGQVAADCAQICTTMGITHADVNFGVVPLAHSYGFSNLLTPLLLRGVKLALSEDRLPRALLAGLERTGATVFPGTPVLFQHLAALEVPRPPRLRLCLSAGAPLPRATWQAFQARFGLGIHTFYGSSECGGIAYDRAGTLAEEGFVGTALDGVSLTPRADGRLEVRSAAVGGGYFPDADPEALDGARFVPGDLVEMTAHGLKLTGRAGDLINVAGRKLNPAEIERCAAQYPGVRAAVAFGVVSPVRGEEPVVCVAGDGLDPAAVLRHCTTNLPAWQAPRDVWLVPEIPADERGKTSRRRLAERYRARA